MEIRANYVFVGMFTILLLLSGLGFALWTAKRGKDVPLSEYDIFFTESVRGLSVNSDVLFTGIKVGKVQQIKISEVTPGAVRVRISIFSDTPVREDSQAQLAVMGLTGASQITISGGTSLSPLMRVGEDEVGVIHYEPSPLSQVPDMVASISHLLRRMDRMFSEKNTQAVTSMLSSLAKVSDVFATRTKEIDAVLASAESAARNVDLLVFNANKALMTDVAATSASINKIVKRVDTTLVAMEPGLKQFSTQGLSEMRMLMTEMRNLVHVLTRVGQKLESDPRRFLFGEPVKEYNNR